MNDKKKLVLNKLEIIGFLLYFMILSIERTLALVFSVWMGIEYSLLSGNIVPIISYALTAASLVAGLIIIGKPVAAMSESLFTKETYDFGNYKRLILGSMVLLVGGMMHTGLTILVMQFVSYGFLIMSMIVRTIRAIYEGKDKATANLSLIYLVCFSMTIPVVYLTKLTGGQATAFYIVEYVAALTLIVLFGLSLLRFFNEGVIRFNVFVFLSMLALCGATLALKWTDEVNWFVLGAAAATALTYLVQLVFLIAKKAKPSKQ